MQSNKDTELAPATDPRSVAARRYSGRQDRAYAGLISSFARRGAAHRRRAAAAKLHSTPIRPAPPGRGLLEP